MLIRDLLANWNSENNEMSNSWQWLCENNIATEEMVEGKSAIKKLHD